MPANRTSNLLEPDATTSGCYSDVTPLVSIAISLKRIADMMESTGETVTEIMDGAAAEYRKAKLQPSPDGTSQKS
jgi:hypothetical protein